MTQDQWASLLLKIGVTCGWVAIVRWIWIYFRLQRDLWRDPVGLSLVVKSGLLAGLLILTSLGLFFHLSRIDNRIVQWVAVVLIGAIGPVMEWRTQVWKHASRQRKEANERQSDAAGATDAAGAGSGTGS